MMAPKLNSRTRSFTNQFSFNSLAKTSKWYDSSAPISNKILWRSIIRDSAIKMPPVSFSDVFERTKSLKNMHENEYEQTLVYLANAQRKNAPNRIARLLTHLSNLPYGLAATQSITSLINIYTECYETVVDIQPIQSISDCDSFYKIYRHFLTRQLVAIPKLCHGLLEKSTDPNNLFSVNDASEHLTAFIDKFASQRLGTRVASAHNMTLYDQLRNNRSTKMGLFDEDCDGMCRYFVANCNVFDVFSHSNQVHKSSDN